MDINPETHSQGIDSANPGLFQIDDKCAQTSAARTLSIINPVKYYINAPSISFGARRSGGVSGGSGVSFIQMHKKQRAFFLPITCE